MIWIVTKYLTPKGFRGLTIFPFVFMRNQIDKRDLVFLNHEKIHLRQQLELLIVPFFVWYGVEFLYHFLLLKNKSKAYRAISFEKEAYEHQDDLNYLKRKKIYSFLRYYSL